MRTVISVSLTKAMAAEVEEAVKTSGKPRGEIIKDALREYLWEERFKSIRRRLRAKARDRRLVTDEDVFKAVS